MVHQGLKRTASRCVLLALLLAAACAELGPARAPLVPAPQQAIEQPPPAPREFRAAWVATVSNIDWPSKKGLPAEQQRQEIIRIVERAVDLKLNALIIQVRPAADAIYPSRLEPWSEYLSGEQGKAPEPYYDPLLVWIEEAHQRGLEIHAWFNPYRARHSAATSPLASSHMSKTHPGVVKEYGGFLWMDPGEAIAAQRTLDVILDVVRRYDIDGVHIDDYFYPYPVTASGAPITSTAAKAPEIDFPDGPSWNAYLRAGGKLARADWRRQNVNALVERIYQSVRSEKSWVRFGVSPFGLGRPDRRPPGISGFSQYDKLYADVELWLANGWLDYLVPQLYWPIDQAPQAFGVLLDYWARENSRGRHVFSGLYTSRIDATTRSWKPAEILNQITLVRERAAANPVLGGHVHFSMIALMENRQDLTDQLKATSYTAPALIPASAWLDKVAPPPSVNATAQRQGKQTTLTLASGMGAPAWQFAIWARYGLEWRFSVAQAGARDGRALLRMDNDNANGSLEAIVVSAINRAGIEGARLTLVRELQSTGTSK